MLDVGAPLYVVTLGPNSETEEIAEVVECLANSGAHATDSRDDIMAGDHLVGGVVDWNRDDYFRRARTDCADTAPTPYWGRVQGHPLVAGQRSNRMWLSIPLRCGGLILRERAERK